MTIITTEVPPLSRRDIRAVATDFRKFIRWDEPYLPIVDVIESVLPSIDPDFEFHLGELDEMGSDHGQTYPDKKRIIIRVDVYERACDGYGRDRMTFAHELGHYLLHAGLPLSRSIPRDNIPPFRSSEWQANCFGGELLIPSNFIKMCNDENDIADLFGVSIEAAKIQLDVYKKEGLMT